MVWLIESGTVAVVALAVMAVEAVAMVVRGRRIPTPPDVYLNLIAGAALMALTGMALAGLANWIAGAALLAVALAAHASGLVLRLRRL